MTDSLQLAKDIIIYSITLKFPISGKMSISVLELICISVIIAFTMSLSVARAQIKDRQIGRDRPTRNRGENYDD